MRSDADLPWVALIDKTGPEGRHGRAARARALAQAFEDLGYEAVHFQTLPAEQERTGLVGSAAAATLGVARLLRAVRDEAEQRHRPPTIAILSNAQLALAGRRLRAAGITVWAELHLIEADFDHPWPLRLLLSRAEAALVRVSHHTLCLSALDARRLVDRYGTVPARVSVLPHTVEEDWLQEGPLPSDPRSLIFVGGWNHPPNREAVEFLVRQVMPLLRTKEPGWTLALAGRAMPSTYADHDIVVNADVADMRAAVDSAAVCLAPIWQGGGVRTKVLEAMARGRPLIATRTAMEGMEAIPGEHYLRAETPNEFAEAAMSLGSNPALARAIGERGRRLVMGEHSPHALTEALQDLLPE